MIAPLLLAIFLGAVSPPEIIPSSERAGVDAVGSQIICYCGCERQTITDCPCEVADGVRRDTAVMLRDGKQPSAIIEAYVAEHGTEFRAAPQNKGFGRLAWTLPYAAIGVAALAAFGILRSWSLGPGVPEETPERTSENDDYLLRVEEELSEDE